MLISWLSVCMLCFLPVVTLAQTEELLESIDPELNEEESDKLEQIQWLQEHPVDLNDVTLESLRSIPGVAPADADRVVEFRTHNGPFRSKDQLLQIPDLDEDAARWLQGFVMVRPKKGKGAGRLIVDLRARSLQDIQLREGFRTRSYTGSPNKSYARLNVAFPGKAEAGVLVEKDAGEPTSAGFLSGYVSLQDMGILKHAVIGDFRFEAGQGLVFWQGGGFGKGGNPAETSEKNPRGLVPHRSTDEFHFLRGAGVSTDLALSRINVQFSGFYSNRSLPATTDTSGAISSFFETGIFRTKSELSKRDAVREQVIGGSVLVSGLSGLSLGVVGYYSQFDHPLGTIGGSVMDRTSGGVAGWNGRFEAGGTEVVGEVAAGVRTRPSWIVRGIHRTGRQGSLVLIYRNYSPGYPGLHSSGFGERTDTRNEQGLYLGITLRPMADVAASLFVDNFAFPQRTATIPVPTQGHDVGLNMDVRFAATTDVSVRATMSRHQLMATGADPSEGESHFLADHDQQRIRLTFVHQASRNLRLKTRVERTDIIGSRGVAGEKGTMLFQDIRFSPTHGFTVEGRLCFFQTDSYNTRIYEFENDVRGVFTVPVLYGTGKRWYVLARYDILSGTSLSFKVSETQKEGVRALGSGPGEIEGDTENRITLQVDVRL